VPFSGCRSSNPKFWTDTFSTPHRASSSQRFCHASGKCCTLSLSLSVSVSFDCDWYSQQSFHHAWDSQPPWPALMQCVLAAHNQQTLFHSFLSWNLWKRKQPLALVFPHALRYRSKRPITVMSPHCRTKDSRPRDNKFSGFILRISRLVLLLCSFFSFFNWSILIIQRGFIVIFSYMHVMCFDQIHPSFTLSVLPTFKQFLTVLILFSYVKCFHRIRPQLYSFLTSRHVFSFGEF
jgi:hypothetical protein